MKRFFHNWIDSLLGNDPLGDVAGLLSVILTSLGIGLIIWASLNVINKLEPSEFYKPPAKFGDDLILGGLGILAFLIGSMLFSWWSDPERPK